MTPLAVRLGALVVRFMDERGLPAALAFKELGGERPALLGCLLECTRRRLSKMVAREIADEFALAFEPTPAEVLAIAKIHKE